LRNPEERLNSSMFNGFVNCFTVFH
jgi:hypothetical protein